MEYSRLTELYDKLEVISSRLEMTDLISDFISQVREEELTTILLFIRGQVFPAWSTIELGIADKLMFKALSTVSGVNEDKIGDILREKGDVGLVAEEILVSKQQTTLFNETLTVEKISENLRKLASLTGKGSQDKKLAYITELLTNATPRESRYVVRLILGQLRLGVGDGIVRDAIAKAFDVKPELVERAYNLRSDLGEVAKIARDDGNNGLENVSLTPGQPVRVMLAQKTDSIESAIKDMGVCAFEVKYDGARLQIHKYDDTVELYTRRLENVTRQFPEMVEASRKNINAGSCIIEGEVVAIKVDEGRKPLPFQYLSRRIKRKYNIPEIVKEIPVELNLFDLLYLDGEDKLAEKFSERRRMLAEIISETNAYILSESLVTDDIKRAEEFYKKSLDMGHEGVMVKNLDAPYKPGSRVGYMYKIKPVMESLDLVITGATWGEGRRASWLGSYLLSVYDNESGQFMEIGRMATGLSDQQLEEMTGVLKPTIVRQSGKEVVLNPSIVVEVAYEEIQKSPTYTSGYALRFPRLVRIREDKGVEEADTLSRVEGLLN
ncbi:MAG: ATP-dependent DNA ligase [Candidatus Altiarchaeota archaeon]